jgi:hypothetical protein
VRESEHSRSGGSIGRTLLEMQPVDLGCAVEANALRRHTVEFATRSRTRSRCVLTAFTKDDVDEALDYRAICQ